MRAHATYTDGIYTNMIYLTTILVLLDITLGVRSTAIHEVCQFEYFEPTCNRDEVILIQTARFGRMKIGECVKDDMGLLGCYADVSRQMDRLCSGRERCKDGSVNVVDPTFGSISPCSAEVKNYLEVSYACVKVLRSSDVLCSNVAPSELPLSSFITLPDVAGAGVCGSPDAPYVLRVPHGQKVNLSLLDFHLPLAPELHDAQQALRCDVYATIHEPGTRRTIDVCGGQSRESLVFVSETNIVQIYLNQKMLDGTKKFLLRYQILGCPDVEAPIHGWVERDGSNAVIGCDERKQTWKLRCKGSSWHGVYGNCTEAISEHSEVSSRIMSIPTGMLIAIVIGIACMISFSILLMGIYYLRRRRRRHQQMGQKPLRTQSDEYILSASTASTYATSRDACNMLPAHQNKSCPLCVREKSFPASIAPCGDFAYTWSDSQPRREKVYSAGVYAPLPCRCIPMNVRDLEQKDNVENDIIQQPLPPSSMVNSMCDSVQCAPATSRDHSRDHVQADVGDDNVNTPFLDSNNPDVISQYRTDQPMYQPIGGISTFKNSQVEECCRDG